MDVAQQQNSKNRFRRRTNDDQQLITIQAETTADVKIII